jgi:predicted RNase H-like nuclease (RuvC/YqgF family)
VTETEELVIRRDALKQALETAREQVAARETERRSALAELEAQRAALLTEIATLEESVAALEATTEAIDDAWRTATTEAAAAKAYLKGLSSG